MAKTTWPTPWAAALAESTKGGDNVAGELTAPAEQVAPAAFTNFTPTGTAGGAGNDINMILDIPVQLTVELGRTRIPIKNILQLAQGSVVGAGRRWPASPWTCWSTAS